MRVPGRDKAMLLGAGLVGGGALIMRVVNGEAPAANLPQGTVVTAYFDLSSYLYLSRLIHDVSLIIYELSISLARLHHMYICTYTHVNAYRTYPLSRYLAVNYLTSQRVFSHSNFLFRTHIPTLT